MVSVIILAYNRSSEVLLTIAKLKRYQETLPFKLELIVVDNASADTTSLLVKSQHPDVRLVTKKLNNGIAGWNSGFEIATQPYFLVLDDDSHIYDGLQGAVKRMDEQPDIGILGLQIKDKDFQTDPYLDDKEAWKDNDEIVGFIGCGALIRKDLYKKIGGFADWIYVYTHEFEYGIRALNAGYRINFYQHATVIHRVSSVNRSVKRMRIYAARNEMLIVSKYFGRRKHLYLARVLFNNLKFVKREGFLSGVYILRGFLLFLRDMGHIGRSPVTPGVQQKFADNFWSTKPVFK